jgi:hypothetical protein
MSEPCNDCPNQPKTENGEQTIPDIVAPIKHSGGPPEIHLAMMQHTLPPSYSRAHFLPDGSIQYTKGPDDWEPPSPIEGYERDAENPWFFRPLWKSCQLRMFGTEIKEACECIQVVTICNHPETELDGHGEVTFAMCEECPHRESIPAVRLIPQRTKAI